MTPEQLKQYAEWGAQVRLREIHMELNEIAQHFPAVVSAFTSQVKFAPKAVPAPAKPNGKPNGAVPPARRYHRELQVQQFLAMHPGATTQAIAAALGITSNRVLVLAPRVAKGSRRGSGRTPMSWTLKAAKA